MPKKCLHLLISGRVQGVFFRQATKATAVKHSVRGWVRNLDDGRVEAMLEGDSENVDMVSAWCRRGPANSIVRDIHIENADIGKFSGFEVRY